MSVSALEWARADSPLDQVGQCFVLVFSCRHVELTGTHWQSLHALLLNTLASESARAGCGVGFNASGGLGVGAGVRAGLGVGAAVPLARLRGGLSVGFVLGPAVGVGASLGYALQAAKADGASAGGLLLATEQQRRASEARAANAFVRRVAGGKC